MKLKNQRQWFLRVPWGKLALVSYGHPDGEPVFLVHGRQDSCSVFEPIIEQMSSEYYYVALDMPGNGLSDSFPHGPKLMRFHFLYAMELALLHLGWDKFIFMGHSMGCEQGLFYNVIYPGRITKMILLDAGPTLMRMQIEDPDEYHRSYYESYYENYHRENFFRKTHTRPSAIQALKRLRDLNDDQCAHLLRRNFHTLGDWHPIEAWHPNATSLRLLAKNPFKPSFDVGRMASWLLTEAATSNEAQTSSEAQSPSMEGANEAEIQPGGSANEAQIQPGRSANEPLGPIVESPMDTEGPYGSKTPAGSPDRVLTPISFNLHEDDNEAADSSEYDNTPTAGCSANISLYSRPESSDDSECRLQGGTDEAISSILFSSCEELGFIGQLDKANLNRTQSQMQQDAAASLSLEAVCGSLCGQGVFACCGTQNDNEAENAYEPQNGNEAQSLDETLEADQSRAGRLCAQIQRMRETDEVGYLSWDNRLKNLAPQNYGNEYYFQLFKTIPPTLLIAASDGAKNIPPISKWRQGAKELLDKMATLDNFHRVDVVGSHDVHYTHPEIVAPYINKFLKNKVYSKL